MIIEVIGVLILNLLDKMIWKVNIKAEGVGVIDDAIKKVIREVLASESDINDGKYYLLKDGEKIKVDLSSIGNYLIIHIS